MLGDVYVVSALSTDAAVKVSKVSVTKAITKKEKEKKFQKTEVYVIIRCVSVTYPNLWILDFHWLVHPF